MKISREAIENYIAENNLEAADGFVYGFETYDDAENFANQIDSEVVEIKKRDGQHWKNMGFAGKAFDLTPAMFGDDYDIFPSDSNIFKEMIYPFLENAADYEEAQNIMEKYNDLVEAVENLEDGGIVLACNNGEGIYVPEQSFPKEVMEYYFDVYSYAIAVAIP